MNYFKKILIGILFIQLFSSLIFAYIGYFQSNTVTKMIIEKKERSTDHLIKNVVKKVRDQYLEYGKDILSDPEVIKAFSTHNREKLFEVIPEFKSEVQFLI